MKSRKKTFLIIISIFSGLCISGNIYAATQVAASCSYADVSAAVTVASPGDIVSVPAGTCSWASQLVIKKGLTLKGAGVGNTKIISNYVAVNPSQSTNSLNYLFIYEPFSPQLNEAFRLTGFEIDTNGKSGALMLKNNTVSIINEVRVDHNKFENSTSSYKVGNAIEIYGTVYGVIDNNEILMPTIHTQTMEVGGLNQMSWDNLTFTYGTNNSMYFEDNTISFYNGGLDSGTGGIWTARYNTFIYLGNTGGGGALGAHGNMGLGNNYGVMGFEEYGNYMTSTNNKSLSLFTQRGGKALIFYNQTDTKGGGFAKVREEYPDDDNPTTNPQPQHVSDSYYWNNRNQATIVQPTIINESHNASDGGNNYINCSTCSWTTRQFQDGQNYYMFSVQIDSGTGAGQIRSINGNTTTRANITPDWSVIPDSSSHFNILYKYADIIRENRDYFNYTNSFNGSSGIGCGTLASRPATCTPGVGYWATSQSCSDLTGMVGKNPATPISGTLYKCTSNNTWTAYYTPYAYPHPLTKPSPPNWP